MATEPITGNAGAVPPAGAPHEVSQPVSGATPEQVARARANERTLAPLRAQGGLPTAPAETPHAAPPPGPEMARGRPAGRGKRPVAVPTIAPAVDAPPVGETGTELVGEAAAEAVSQAMANVPLPPDPNDDPVTAEPPRGKPRPITDPGKRITGGFGDVMGEPVYQPLDGFEVGTLVVGLLEELKTQVPNDLRFSMAVTYPRVQVSVRVEVRGFGEERLGVDIRRVAPMAGTEPIDLARQHAEEICFVLETQRNEVDAEGESSLPPNAMREEIGSPIPRKQRRKDGSGLEHWVDV